VTASNSVRGKLWAGLERPLHAHKVRINQASLQSESSIRQ